MDLRETAVKVWVALLFTVYTVVRVTLRLLIGKARRDRAIAISEFHFSRGYSVRYGILWGAPYEPHVSHVVDVVMRGGGRVFIDAGAYRGYFTLKAYRRLRKRSGAKIIAVEPDPINFTVLSKKIPSDGVISLVNRAVYVSDDVDQAFHVDASSRGAGSIKPTIEHMRNGYLSGQTILVKTIRLYTLISRFNLDRVDLVKMDVQGAEHPVLTDPSLDLSRVRNMVVEVHYRFDSEESLEIIRALMTKGFKVAPLYPDKRANYWYLLAYRGEMPW